MKYKTTTTTTTHTTTRAAVLRSLKDTVFNVGMFDDMGPGNNSYIYVTYKDDPEHVLVIQRDPEAEALEEFKALKVGDIASIQEFWGVTGDACTIEITHTFNNKSCESVTVERYREEQTEEQTEEGTEEQTEEGTEEQTEEPGPDRREILRNVYEIAARACGLVKTSAAVAGNCIINCTMIIFILILLFSLFAGPYVLTVFIPALFAECITLGDFAACMFGGLLCLGAPIISSIFLYEMVRYTTPYEYITKRFAAIRTA